MTVREKVIIVGAGPVSHSQQTSEETDESTRLSRLDDMRRASREASLAKAILMRSSMRRANSIA
jgi:hypothetical protein